MFVALLVSQPPISSLKAPAAENVCSPEQRRKMKIKANL
jgi:hypothetical protein